MRLRTRGLSMREKQGELTVGKKRGRLKAVVTRAQFSCDSFVFLGELGEFLLVFWQQTFLDCFKFYRLEVADFLGVRLLPLAAACCDGRRFGRRCCGC